MAYLILISLDMEESPNCYPTENNRRFVIFRQISLRLEARIWKFVSVTLACEILQETPLYQSMTQEDVRLTLVRSFVPNLNCYKIFIVNELIQDVVLIEGIVMDLNTRAYFAAPCYIPRTVHKIVMPVSSYFTRPKDLTQHTKLLIIPCKDVDEMDIMDKAEDLSDLVSNPSNSCLIPKSYGKTMKRKKRLTKKAKEGEKRRRDQEKVLSVPEEEEWVVHAMGGIQVIDDNEQINEADRKYSVISDRSEDKSSGGSSSSSKSTTSVATVKSEGAEIIKDVIRLRGKRNSGGKSTNK